MGQRLTRGVGPTCTVAVAIPRVDILNPPAETG